MWRYTGRDRPPFATTPAPDQASVRDYPRPPRKDVKIALLQAANGSSCCEWKGRAAYGSLRTTDRRLPRVAWSYAEPLPGFEALRDRIAFYPAPLECRVDGQRVLPQPGRFYAGWIAPEVVGPFKGGPSSEGW